MYLVIGINADTSITYSIYIPQKHAKEIINNLLAEHNNDVIPNRVLLIDNDNNGPFICDSWYNDEE